MKENQPHINVTPLIDVLLVLLIIFMVVSPLKPSDFKTRIPQMPNERPAGVHPHTLVVSIASDSTLKLNDENKNLGPIGDPKRLIESLATIFLEREKNLVYDESGEKIQKTVFIKAPRNLAYGEVVRVVDAVKIAGADPISLQIDDLR